MMETTAYSVTDSSYEDVDFLCEFSNSKAKDIYEKVAFDLLEGEDHVPSIFNSGRQEQQVMHQSQGSAPSANILRRSSGGFSTASASSWDRVVNSNNNSPTCGDDETAVSFDNSWSPFGSTQSKAKHQQQLQIEMPPFQFLSGVKNSDMKSTPPSDSIDYQFMYTNSNPNTPVVSSPTTMPRNMFEPSTNAIFPVGTGYTQQLKPMQQYHDVFDSFNSLSLEDEYGSSAEKYNSLYSSGLMNTTDMMAIKNARMSAANNMYFARHGVKTNSNLGANQVVVCIIEFKHGRSGRYEYNQFVFNSGFNPNVYGYDVPSGGMVTVGEFVFVEADRGEDLGRIIDILIVKLSEDLHTMLQQYQQLNLDGKVVRRATVKDMQRLAHKAREETKAVLVCRQKVKEHGLDLDIDDAEFQFDRKKLTFYYRADKRVDFRELVRELYKIYRARIWMQKSDGASPVPSPSSIDK